MEGGCLSDLHVRVSVNEIHMRGVRHLYALAFAAIVTSALPACAAYRKCGVAGCPGDARITADIQALYRHYPATQPPNLVYVQTLDHVVYLSGRVDTDVERLTAEAAALSVDGVTRVVNSIALSFAGR
jgi:osmotically-inducible protein OsmY